MVMCGSSEGITQALNVQQFSLAKVSRHDSLNNPTWRLLSQDLVRIVASLIAGACVQENASLCLGDNAASTRKGVTGGGDRSTGQQSNRSLGQQFNRPISQHADRRTCEECFGLVGLAVMGSGFKTNFF